MKNLRKISCLVMSGLWISAAANAMNSNSVFNNQKSQSSSDCRQISDQENIDPNVSHPAKKQKIEVRSLKQKDIRDCFEKSVTHTLLNFTTTKADDILGNPKNIVYHLANKKKPFTQNDIQRVVEERISEDGIPYDARKIQEIINRVTSAARCIGNNQNGDDLYWEKIQDCRKYDKNFLHPIICCSVSQKWKSAAKEWKVIYYGEVEGTTCICGKEEIKYISGIYNRLNGNELYPIGSRCINKFKSEEMNKDINEYKEAFNKISNGISKLKEIVGKGESIKFTARLFSEELIRYLNQKEAIDDNESQFFLDVIGKRYKRSGEREQINKIIESHIVPYIQKLPQNEKIIIDRQMLKQLKG